MQETPRRGNCGCFTLAGMRKGTPGVVRDDMDEMTDPAALATIRDIRQDVSSNWLSVACLLLRPGFYMW